MLGIELKVLHKLEEALPLSCILSPDSILYLCTSDFHSPVISTLPKVTGDKKKGYAGSRDFTFLIVSRDDKVKIMRRLARDWGCNLLLLHSYDVSQQEQAHF
jgi:hypothetical protein